MQYRERPLNLERVRTSERMLAILDQRRLLNGIYVGRLLVASANFAWAVLFALFANPMNTVIAATAFVVAMALTAVSYIHTEVNRKHAGPAFLYAQFVHDLFLITVVVHLTGGGDSQFAALYILVNATAALLLPIASSLLLALLGSVLYVGDAFWVSGGDITIPLLLQLVVFVLVVLGTSYIAGRLQEAGQGREQLEAELASAQVRAADILANIRSAIITVDDLGRLLYANPAAARLLGVPFETLAGAPVLDAVRNVAPSVADAVEATIAGGQGSVRREGAMRRDGRSVPLGITTTSVVGDLRPVGGATTVIVQDISDEKRLESLRLRAQRLEAVAELSASLAHEIKNPLASIRSAVEQLSQRVAATDDERTLGELITRESDRLSRLLSEFLDFARVQSARRDHLDLRELVHAATTLAGTHPDRGAGVEVSIDLPEAPVPLEGDEDLLHRALFNLVLNACQAVGERGQVQVTLRRRTADEGATGLPMREVYAIEVRDDGPGIPADIQDRLFEPFATTKPGGSGLGLAVVHRAIETHRGVILVDSDSQGTRFTVYLPAEAEASGVLQ